MVWRFRFFHCGPGKTVQATHGPAWAVLILNSSLLSLTQATALDSLPF